MGGAIAVESGDLGRHSWQRFTDNRARRVAGRISACSGLRRRDRPCATPNAAPWRTFEIAATVWPAVRSWSGWRQAAAAESRSKAGRVRDPRHVCSRRTSRSAGSGRASLPGRAARGGGLANSGPSTRSPARRSRATRPSGLGLGEGRGGGLDNTGSIGRIVAASLRRQYRGRRRWGCTRCRRPSLGGGIANLGSIGLICGEHLRREPSARTSIFISLFRRRRDLQRHGRRGRRTTESRLVGTLLSGNVATNGADCYSTAAMASLGFNLAQAPDSSCSFASAGRHRRRGSADPAAGRQRLRGRLAGRRLPADGGAPGDQPGGRCRTLHRSPAPRSTRAAPSGPSDIAGVPNAPGGDGCDIGAFESDGALATVQLGLSVADSTDPVASGWSAGNLVYTVALASLGSATASGIDVAVVAAVARGRHPRLRDALDRKLGRQHLDAYPPWRAARTPPLPSF